MHDREVVILIYIGGWSCHPRRCIFNNLRLHPVNHNIHLNIRRGLASFKDNEYQHPAVSSTLIQTTLMAISLPRSLKHPASDMRYIDARSNYNLPARPTLSTLLDALESPLTLAFHMSDSHPGTTAVLHCSKLLIDFLIDKDTYF